MFELKSNLIAEILIIRDG